MWCWTTDEELNISVNTDLNEKKVSATLSSCATTTEGQAEDNHTAQSTACVYGISKEVFDTADPVGSTCSPFPSSVELRQGVSLGSQAGAKP